MWISIRRSKGQRFVHAGISVVRSARLGSFLSLVNSDSMSKDTMISLSKIVSLLTVDTKWAEFVTVYFDFPVKETRCWNAHNQETQQQESCATADCWGSKPLSEQQGSKCTNESCWKTTNYSRASCFITSHMTSRPHRLKKTSSMQSKPRDLHHTRLHCETNEKLSFYCYSPQWITTTFSFLG